MLNQTVTARRYVGTLDPGEQRFGEVPSRAERTFLHLLHIWEHEFQSEKGHFDGPVLREAVSNQVEEVRR